jgi:hypothetical protein
MNAFSKRLNIKSNKNKLVTLATCVAGVILLLFQPIFAQVTNPQSEAAGLTGTVPAPPPTQAATISFPVNGQVFTDVPINVTGVCKTDLTVKLFKNDIFSGSDVCVNNSYTITIDLFSGENELVAIVFDDLDQQGPDSNHVFIEYDDDFGTDAAFQRVNITSNFAKRGANPHQQLDWPFIITGGQQPYAIKVDWGDGVEDLSTLELSGDFIVSHIYDESGVYRVIIKVTDGRDQSSFLQVVSIVNGPLGEIIQDEGLEGLAPAGRVIYRWITWPLFLLLTLIFSTFWIGRRYEINRLKKQFAEHKIVFSKDK